MHEFMVRERNIFYNGANYKWTQLLGNIPLTVKNNCSIKVLNSKEKFVVFGVIDCNYLHHRDSADEN